MTKPLAVVPLLALAAVTSAAMRAHAASITYALIPVTVNAAPPLVGPYTVTGTITTDGTITSLATPYLSTSDIVSWTFDLTIGSAPPITLSNASPGENFFVLGTALTATASQLLFNFSSLDNEIDFEGDNVPPYPVFTSFYMQGLTSNVTSGPGAHFHWCAPDPSAPSSSVCWGLSGDQHVGITPIATAVPAETPLPAALPLFATGLGVMGLLGWRRKRKPDANLASE